ncbi:MAG: 1-(5-phosphoribosyl)-5-[(5-phosphoribosylamino)methylideneamino]imidazole-4-carboxamide isomerase [Spirochaetales bacterium]|nr:1-(5-phosphoribosyl)-5-[(5-phosphoribosylamino)methylideneamino]imidazole-4-carboxamide isomerase [Spirochaetales bacterium]
MSVMIIPSIDILNQECVRLLQGRYSDVTVYSSDPVKIAQSYEKAGVKRIHIVDLDGARGKGKNNRTIIEKIRQNVSCTLDTGGGIRSEEDIRELLAIGIDKLIVGTVFASEPGKVKKWVDKYGDFFVAGIDAYDGKVKIAGWEADSGQNDRVLAKKAGEIGINEIIYTNISGDGTLEGPDIARTRMIAEESGIPVILSGGISSSEDVENVVKENCPLIKGIIIGKAIYEQKVSVPDLIKSFQK